jgi:hypothetical protein
MKIIIAIALLVLIMTSCKKNDTSSTSPSSLPLNTITATIEGTNYTFNTLIDDTTYNNWDSLGIQIIFMSAFDKSLNTINLSIQGYGDNPVTTQTYTQSGFYEPLYLVINKEFYGMTKRTIEPHPVSFTITSISSTTIEGKFSGDIYLNYDTTKTPLLITNGAFHFNH